jgi:hypothetical protein
MNPLPPALRHRVLRLPFLLLLLLLLAAGRAAAAEFPFTLHPERGRYLLGEPVYLRMRGAFARPPALEENTVALVVRSPDGFEHAYRPPLLFRARPGGGSAARTRYARLIAESGGWVFPRPGRYLLRLRAPAGGGPRGGDPLSREPQALSDTVSLDIAAPSAESDKRAFAILSRAPGEYALAVYLEGGDHLAAGMAVLRELVAFPNAYARTAAFVLCSDWSQDYRAASGGTPRPLDLDSALAYARWEKAGGAYPALRTAYRLGQAVALQSSRHPGDLALASARSRLQAFRDSLTAEERLLFDSF